jgi:predicted NBD/HSP70 family sugar kinase
VISVRERALEVLRAHWRPEVGYCVPNPDTYPHQWLWDSAFHSVAWARLGDDRGVVELHALLSGQLACGLVPHMRYGAIRPAGWLGPLPSSSSLTQPPMYGHAIAELLRAGFEVSAEDQAAATRGLRWLLDERRDTSGLIFIVHPWEAGNDHAPRWDGWGAPGTNPETYDQHARARWNQDLMRDVVIAADGAAISSSRFVVCPAGFNAYVAFNARELGRAIGDVDLQRDADELAELIDELLWDTETGLWVDRPVVGGDGRTHTIPISDGVIPALVSADPERARRALNRLHDPDFFGGTPFGPTNVAQNQPSYDPSAYWRGPAWPNISYLLWLAARRWHDRRLADEIAQQTIAGAEVSGWAEYWNPHTGAGLGAAPQSWTSLVATMAHEPIPVLEIGGTHLTAARVSCRPWALVPGSLNRIALDADRPAEELLDDIAVAARTLGNGHQLDLVVAIPGPFDYAQGVGGFTGVGKFASLHGVDLRSELLSRLAPRPHRVRFLNDADAFGLGEYAVGAARGHDRAVCITLGTGVGSAFLDRGEPVNDGPLVPPDGSIHLLFHAGRPLEETVSRRAIRAAYARAVGVLEQPLDVHAIAARAREGDPLANLVLHQAFVGLGVALAPVLERFEAGVLVVGGSMAGSFDIIGPAVGDGIARVRPSLGRLPIRPARRPDDAALIGAAYWAASEPD